MGPPNMEVSGGLQAVPAMQRPGFTKLMDKLEDGDTLVVTKLDRIGRDSIDVQHTVQLCKERGLRARPDHRADPCRPGSR